MLRIAPARNRSMRPGRKAAPPDEIDCDMTTATTASSVILTERAARRLLDLAAGDPSKPVLRIAVEGGGCSGFQYRMDMVAGPEADDEIVEREGARVAIDSVSVPYISGSEIDFVDDLIGSSFRIKNPQATAACGCGTSFSI
jgi:iron-sulfur cluster assembly accessory protein